MTLFDTLSIVGVGLLGGSLGLAAKRRGLVRHVVGIGRDSNKLLEAQRHGCIDSICTAIPQGVANADLIVFCTPVDLIAPQILEHRTAFRPGSLVTDVGSTKREIVNALRGQMPDGVAFIGSHPMAGSEKKGAAYADEQLFLNRATILTTDPSVPANHFDRLQQFWEALGSRVHRMGADEHDRTVAYVSHLPHVVAAALAAVVDPKLLPLSAGGFRDTTRIASAAPAIWEPIFRTNREQVLASCEAFAAQFDEFRQLLAAGDSDGLIRWLHNGKQVRDALGS